ncbi:MAG: hypothetical protein ACLU99_12700 [Alphaproteobacteria bacterium]
MDNGLSQSVFYPFGLKVVIDDFVGKAAVTDGLFSGIKRFDGLEQA